MKYFNTPDIFAIDLFDGENFRDNLVTLMANVIRKLQSTTSDNVVITNLIVEVRVLIFWRQIQTAFCRILLQSCKKRRCGATPHL